MNNEYRKTERGSAGIRLLIVALVLFLIANAGYQYVPVAYQGENLKQEIQTAVVNGVALPGIGKNPADAVRDKVIAAVRNNNLPANTVVQVKQLNAVVQAHVAYTKPVPVLPFGLYTRNYEFDYTATPTGFLSKE
jgi:hypothetical protein